MAKIYSSVEDLIGRTPLLHLKRLGHKYSLGASVIAKLESFNPGGSAKDRVAKAMIDDAESKGLIKEGATVIEPTSGNTGIGLAAVCAARGYRAIIVMPDSMSLERQKLMKAYGAELVLTPGALGMKGAIKKAQELRDEIPGSFIPDQFSNPANAAAHRCTTGPEIWEDCDGEIDIFVCGIGTGGTITGVGEYLRSKKNDIQIIGVEPFSSPFLTQGESGPHGLQGIGAGFVPEVLNTEIYDEILTVKDEDAYKMGKELGKTEGVLAGISSGAALYAAINIAKRAENKGKKIVVILPDTGDRYLSTTMFSE